jgi:hypothetical protein
VLSDSVLQPIAGALFSEACHWAGSFSAGHSSGETRIESYTRMLWTAVRRKAAYLPG